MFPVLTGGFFTTEPPGSPVKLFLYDNFPEVELQGQGKRTFLQLLTKPVVSKGYKFIHHQFIKLCTNF